VLNALAVMRYRISSEVSLAADCGSAAEGKSVYATSFSAAGLVGTSMSSSWVILRQQGVKSLMISMSISGLAGLMNDGLSG
jgi:hypothetical protein